MGIFQSDKVVILLHVFFIELGLPVLHEEDRHFFSGSFVSKPPHKIRSVIIGRVIQILTKHSLNSYWV